MPCGVGVSIGGGPLSRMERSEIRAESASWDPGFRFASSGLRAESRRASSPLVSSPARGLAGLSLLRLPRKGMRNAGRFTAPAAPRVVGHVAPCTCGDARRCVALRFTRSRASLHRLDQDGLGNRNTLRSANNDLSACNSQQRPGWRFDQVRASPHCWVLGPPTLACRSSPLSVPTARRPACATGTSHPAPRRDETGAL